MGSIIGFLNLLHGNGKSSYHGKCQSFSSVPGGCSCTETSRGWFVVLGWQSALVGLAYTAAQQFLAIAVLSDPSYVIQGWHGSLLTMAIAFFAIIFNTVGMRYLPLLEGVVLVLHVLGFFAVIIVLWVFGPRSSTAFTEFQDNSDWGNMGLACLTGLLAPAISLIGADSVCHLSEELHDASKVLPLTMIVAGLSNYVFGFVTIVTLMCNVGDVANALSSPTGQPYVAILLAATGSLRLTMFFTALVGILVVFATINQVTTSSRQLFAFARDQGLPYSNFLAKVRAPLQLRPFRCSIKRTC